MVYAEAAKLLPLLLPYLRQVPAPLLMRALQVADELKSRKIDRILHGNPLALMGRLPSLKEVGMEE